MVYLTRILGYAKNYAKNVIKKERRYLQDGFLDKFRMTIKGGTGGSGLSQYGGKGGNGGDVIIRAKEGFTLRDLQKYVKDKTLAAGTGFDSSKRGILGAAGEDLIINVPPGVQVYHENGTLIGEVNEADKKLIVAMGGVGGCEETNFSGQRGESHAVILDLKLISDVALVGFPNAGKSTLLNCVSRARPRIAAYPFTTVKPNLGKIVYPDFREITITDLPGLIEGAHKNIGMGHDFLKHLERSKFLLFVIDIQGFRLSARHNWRNCLETILLLNREIELYKPELLSIPAMLVLNKMDTKNAKELYAKFKPQFENLEDVVSSEYEEIGVEKVLKFEKILPLSLINKDKKEIQLLKETIRENLDKINEVEELKLRKVMPEYELVQKLKRQLKQTAPTLV